MRCMDAVGLYIDSMKHTFCGALYSRYNYSYFIDEETGSEMLSNFPKITQPLSSRYDSKVLSTTWIYLLELPDENLLRLLN